jgi:hypothetical protein
MAYDLRDLGHSTRIILGELQAILSSISHDEERWACRLIWPLDPADMWWFGESVFVSHTYCHPYDHLVKVICFRFPAFLGDHSDERATLYVCILGWPIWCGLHSCPPKKNAASMCTRRFIVSGSQSGCSSIHIIAALTLSIPTRAVAIA